MNSLKQRQNQLDPFLCEVLCQCAEVVHRKYQDAQIILYGSQARGQATPQSDIDLLVLLNLEIDSQEKNDLHDRLYEVGLAHDRVISALIKSIPCWEQPLSRATSLYQSIQGEGILVA